MDPTLKAVMQSAARHIATGGGMGVTVGTAGTGGPTFLGLTFEQWNGLAIFLAGLIAAILDKLPEKQKPQ